MLGGEMWIRRLQIERFRGIESAQVEFGERQTMFIGPNGAGKSTILEALALLFGRDKLVRTLTEHDFYASNAPKSHPCGELVAKLDVETMSRLDWRARWFAIFPSNFDLNAGSQVWTYLFTDDAII
jgi:predicted ATP-dependent endonuclease of OLD family